MENNRSTAEKVDFLAKIFGDKFVSEQLGITSAQLWVYKKGKTIPKKLAADKIDLLYRETNLFLSKIGAEGYGQK